MKNTAATLAYLQQRFKLDLNQKSPIEIPNIGRWQLPSILHDLGLKEGVEIGIAAGAFSKRLASTGLKVHGVDPYSPQAGYRDYRLRSTFKRLETEAHQRLDQYDYEFIKLTSMGAVSRFSCDSLGFVYIDGDHSYDMVMKDIKAWSKKVRKGGVIAGHDYARQAHTKVVEAVNDYTKEYNINPWFVLGRQAKIPGERRDAIRSWLWIK